MATFVGSYVNKVDRKGRVSVPARFRAAVAGQAIVVSPSYDAGAIDACDHERITLVAAGLDDPDLYTSEQRELASLILARTEELAFDAEGRVLLPKSLIELAEIDGQASFVGVGPTFQIWSPDRYQAYEQQALARAKGQSVSLRMLPLPNRGRGRGNGQ